MVLRIHIQMLVMRAQGMCMMDFLMVIITKRVIAIRCLKIIVLWIVAGVTALDMLPLGVALVVALAL